MSQDLKPCPFCGAGQTEIRENGRMWTGQRMSDPVSVTVMHWCEREDGQPQSTASVTGRDHESAVRLWNTRAQAPDVEPLTQAQLREFWAEATPLRMPELPPHEFGAREMAFACAIERAHGIGAAKEQP